MGIENRDFKGVWIPKEVWLDERLSAVEKIILVEIDSLDSSERGCWASNQHIAEFCQVSERTVSAAISKLKQLGYVYVQAFDGRQRELKSKFTRPQGRDANFADEGSKNCEADLQESRQSNTYINTNKNTDNKEIYSAVLQHLNAKAGTNYRPSGKDAQRHINARLAEGFTVEDFKTVIDKKCAEWLGTDYEQYLRPATLFGTKFESYLNAPAKARKGRAGVEIKEPSEDDLIGIL